MTLLAPVLLFLAAFSQDPETDRLKKEMEKLKADNAELLRQIAVYAVQMKELNESVTKLQGAREKKSDVELTREEMIRMEQARQARLLAQAELDAARAAKPVPSPAAPPPGPKIEGPLVGGNSNAAPKKALEAKVTAVANEIGLVVISIGRDDGVLEGDEFTVYRDGDFVAKIEIDRSDRKWSAGKVVLKRTEPRVADNVSNHIFVSTPRGSARMLAPAPTAAPAPGSTDELKALRKELDDVRNQVRMLSDRVIPSWQDQGLAMEDLSEPIRSQLRILNGVMVRQVREGSPAAKFGFKPYDVVPDVGEAQVLQVLKEGGKLTIYRQGKPETLQGDRGR
jgi:hypothetical protein